MKKINNQKKITDNLIFPHESVIQITIHINGRKVRSQLIDK